MLQYLWCFYGPPMCHECREHVLGVLLPIPGVNETPERARLIQEPHLVKMRRIGDRLNDTCTALDHGAVEKGDAVDNDLVA